MRILYIHQHFCTPAGSSGTRSYEFARRWARAGHEVQILSGTGYDATLPANEEIDVEGIHVRTLGVSYDASMGFVRRLWSFVVFALKSMWYAARSREVDVVLATSTPLTVVLPGLAACWIARKPLVFEVRDVWPDAAVEAGVLKNPLLIRLALCLEMLAYRNAVRIVPLSTGMRDRISRKTRGKFDHKMTVIPNCSDLDRFGPHVDGTELRRQNQAEAKFIILYTGAINLANDVPYLAKTVDLLKHDKGMEWWFVGGGNRLEYLRKEVEHFGASNVHFFGLRAKEEIPTFAAAADVGIVTFIPQPVYFENSPNKFFDYIAAGLPAIFNRSTWLEPYIREYQIGWCCRPDHPEDMANRLRQLRDAPSQRKTMGDNARRLAEERFSRDMMATLYLKLLQSCTEQSMT